MRLELTTPSLPRKCSTNELQRHKLFPKTIRTNQKSMTRSYFYCSSGRRGSNPPPIAWKAIALPNELLPHFNIKNNPHSFCGRGWTRTTELRRGQIYSLLQLPLCDSPPLRKVSRWRDSNPRPADYKSAALAS